MSSSGRGTWLQDLYSRSRHIGASVAELVQRIFVGDASSRGQRLNTGYFWCFFFPSQKEVRTLINQIEEDPAVAKAAYAAYQTLSRQKYGHLMIDTTRASVGRPSRYRASSITVPALGPEFYPAEGSAGAEAPVLAPPTQPPARRRRG